MALFSIYANRHAHIWAIPFCACREARCRQMWSCPKLIVCFARLVGAEPEPQALGHYRPPRSTA